MLRLWRGLHEKWPLHILHVQCLNTWSSVGDDTGDVVQILLEEVMSLAAWENVALSNSLFLSHLQFKTWSLSLLLLPPCPLLAVMLLPPAMMLCLSLLPWCHTPPSYHDGRPHPFAMMACPSFQPCLWYPKPELTLSQTAFWSWYFVTVTEK